MINKEDKNNLMNMVSVIIPCYNSEHTIINTLKSLQNQTIKNFEVVFVNDGSVDNTKIVIDKFIEETDIERVTYVEQSNSGVSAARNKGLKIAKGEYICFLDSDDVYHPQFIELLCKSIQYNNVDVAYCRFKKSIETTKNYEIDSSVILKSQSEILKDFTYKDIPIGMWSFIYKKSIIMNHNIMFNEGYRYGEDTHFTYQYLMEVKHGVFINLPLYGYLDNPLSAMNTINWKMTDAIKAAIDIENKLKIKGNHFYIEELPQISNVIIWTIAKDFSIASDKKLFNRLIKDYDVTTTMKKLQDMKKNKLIFLTSTLYSISPILFYMFFSILGKIIKMIQYVDF